MLHDFDDDLAQGAIDLKAVRERLAQELDCCLKAFSELIRSERPLGYANWVKVYTDSPAAKAFWKVLQTDPQVQTAVSASMRQEAELLSSLLPKGARLRVLLRRPKMPVYPEVVLDSPLAMRRGKGSLLECCPVAARLIYPQPDKRSSEEEAGLIGVEPKDVCVEDRYGLVVVRVSSLNQAYSCASQRFEPQRKSHTGRVFDHIQVPTTTIHRWIPLEQIRCEAEKGRLHHAVDHHWEGQWL